MQVTIEGVVGSDVLGAGEQRTVEHTDYIRGLLRSRIVKVIEWHHDSPQEPETAAVVEDSPAVVDEPQEKRRSRRRTAAASEDE